MSAYIVSAVYAEVIDEPQVYETEVDATSVEDAERLAREEAIAGNGGDPTNEDDQRTYALADVFARLKYEGIEDLLHAGRDEVRFALGVLDDLQVAAFIDQGLASLHVRLVDGAEPEEYNPDLANALEAACNAWDRVADMLPGFRDDPVSRDQSKHVGDDGRLRYTADGSEVFPGPTGVRARKGA